MAIALVEEAGTGRASCRAGELAKLNARDTLEGSDTLDGEGIWEPRAS